MNAVTYTRSTWKAMPEEVDRPYIRIRGTIPGLRYKIANVLTPTYDGVHEREAAETRANARLIVEAPMLAKALEDLVHDPNGAGARAFAIAVLARCGGAI